MAMPTPILAFLVRPEQRGLPSAWIEPPRSSCISRGIFSSCWSEVATLPYVQSICRGGMFTVPDGRGCDRPHLGTKDTYVPRNKQRWRGGGGGGASHVYVRNMSVRTYMYISSLPRFLCFLLFRSLSHQVPVTSILGGILLLICNIISIVLNALRLHTLHHKHWISGLDLGNGTRR